MFIFLMLTLITSKATSQITRRVKPGHLQKSKNHIHKGARPLLWPQILSCLLEDFFLNTRIGWKVFQHLMAYSNGI